MFRTRSMELRIAFAIVTGFAGMFAPRCLAALEVPPGFAITRFADVPKPVGIRADAQGNLWVGNQDAVGHVWFVAADASTVTPFGEVMSDPDNIVVDAQGYVASPGNVIVGCNGYLRELDVVTAVVSDLFFGAPVANVGDMDFDPLGRLLLGQPFDILAVENHEISELVALPDRPIGVAVNELGLLYVTRQFGGRVSRLASDGSMLDESFAEIPGEPLCIEYARTGPLAGSLLVSTRHSGSVFRVEIATGQVTPFTTGLGWTTGLAFGPAGELFIADELEQAIFRVVPEPTAALLLLAGGLFIGTPGRRQSAHGNPRGGRVH